MLYDADIIERHVEPARGETAMETALASVWVSVWVSASVWESALDLVNHSSATEWCCR